MKMNVYTLRFINLKKSHEYQSNSSKEIILLKN
jgi:hypothetical protein